MTYSISVVLLHQGDRNSLLESLSIVERQTLKDIEVIIVNQSTEEIASISQQMDLSFNIKIIDENSFAELSDMITGDYVTFLSSNDSLFDWTFEKMYHAIKLSDSDVVLGHFADLNDGVFYFYPWGDNWLTENLTNVQVLQKMDDTDYRIRKQYCSLFGKLFNSKLLQKINQFDINNLIWRLYIHSKTATYINFPTYIYKPVVDVKPLKDSYKIILENYENRIKDCAVLENYDIEIAKKQYIQELANFSAWLKNDGEHLDSEIVYHKLIAAEKGIFPFLDLERLDFTIISNNCVGGLIYKQLGFQYRTPFVGLFILPDDYYKLTKDFRYYMEQELVFEEELISSSWTHEVYPLGHLGDIDIHFLHYSSIEEARTKWEKRKKRINWDNLYFKFDNKDSASEEILNKMDNLPYSNKLILVNRPYKNLKSQCVIPGQEHLPELAIMSDPLNTFDIMAWLKKGGNAL